jgi:hypothetical protein
MYGKAGICILCVEIADTESTRDRDICRLPFTALVEMPALVVDR